MRGVVTGAQRAQYLPKQIPCIGAHTAIMTRLCPFRRTVFRRRRYSEEFLQRKPSPLVSPEGDQHPAMRRPHAAWKTQSRQGAVSAKPKLFGRCLPSRSSSDGCPSKPKSLRALFSRTEVPLNGCLQSRSFSDGVFRAKTLPTVPFRTEVLSGYVLQNRSSFERLSGEPKLLGRNPSEPKLFGAPSS